MNIHEQPMSTFDTTALSQGYIVSRLLAVMMLFIPPGFDCSIVYPFCSAFWQCSVLKTAIELKTDGF